METQSVSPAYDVRGMNVVITGGGGVLCSVMASGLIANGANVAILDRSLEAAEAAVKRMPSGKGAGRAIALPCDVLQAESIQKAVDDTVAAFGSVDGLINGAGGNRPTATTNAEQKFFDLPADAVRSVFDLNLMGTIIPSQVVGRLMAERKQGVILNISSMNSFRPLTRIPAYSAAKAGVSNFTQWLATHMAMEYSPNIRVNAIAPGFFLTEQNRYLMTDKETGKPTQRGSQVLGHTPMGRYGVPEDLIGPTLWLMSPASAFVTGIIVPVDGGFSAYSGV